MVNRKALDPTVKLKVWVRCGGRCAICNKCLLEDGLVGREVTVGELAHIIGQANTEHSPRGISTTPEEERNDANNLMLICPNDHTAIDRKQLGDVMTVELVKGLKQRHERRIRQASELASSKDTVIVRLVGDVAGTAVELTRDAQVQLRWLQVTDSRPIRSHTTRPASRSTCGTFRTLAPTPTSQPHAR